MSENIVNPLDECVRCMEETVQKCGKETVNNLLTAAMRLWNSISDGELPKIATDLYYAKDEDFLYQDFENVLSEENDDLDWYDTEEENKKRALFEEIKWYIDRDECYTGSNSEAIRNALSSMRYDEKKPRRTRKMNDYEVFKLKWLADHGFTLKDAFVAAVNYSKENVSLLLGDPEQSFDIWESERGFDGMIYPCEREWQDECEELDDRPLPQCIDCRCFMIKNKRDRICGNPTSPKYGHYVDDYDRNDCFVSDECELSVSQLPECEDCEHQCPDYLVYEALTDYCSGKIETAETSEYRFKCCTTDNEYVTDADCRQCAKNGCHMCSAARDAEKLLTGECSADELVFESDNTLEEYLKRL